MEKGDPADRSLELHGMYRDFDLYRKREVAKSEEHAAPVWVIEYDNPADVEKERARAESLKLEVLFQQQDSLVIQGDVPATLGYDACGGEKNKTVLTVADYEIVPRSMPTDDFDKYMALASTADPRNAALHGKMTRESLRDMIQRLQDYGTRNSYEGENGLDAAADWAAEQLESYGFTVTRDDFQDGSGWFSRRITPQIIAELPGTESDRIFVFGGHLDSIVRFSSEAPGADDNGSGSATVLEIARVIAESGAKFKHTVRLCLFTGEEQGLLGSKAIARRWRRENLDIIGMVNADMVGYRQPGEPITFSVMGRNADKRFTDIVVQNTKTYFADTLATGVTYACCSDQQSFYENGFPATAVFETPTSSVVYPHYHQRGDLLKNIDMEQVELQAKAIGSSVFLFAELA